jgi:WD40 repeat protein
MPAMKRQLTFSLLNFIYLMSSDLSAQGIDSMISDQIANQVSRSTSGAISKNLADNLLIPQLKIRNESGEVADFSTSSDGKLYSLLHQDGTLRNWDAQLGVQRPAIFAGRKTFSKIASVSSTHVALAAATDGTITAYDVLTGRELRQLTAHNHEISALALSADETLLASIDTEGKLVIWDVKQLTLLKSLPTPYGDAVKLLAFSRDGKTLAAAGNDGLMDVWDVGKGIKTLSLPGKSTIKGIWFAGAAQEEVIAIDEDNQLQSFDLKTGLERLNRKLTDEDLLSVSVDTEANLLALSTESKTIQLLNLTSLAPIKSITTTEEIHPIKVINKGTQVIGSDGKGVLHLWDIASMKEVLKLISTKSGWTVVDDRGRFDSSEAGMPNIAWEAANQEIPLDNFSSNYYEPGLLATTLDKTPYINKQPAVIQAGINLPPEVTLSPGGANRVADQAFTVSINLVDAGGGIGELRFYHNGKIVDKSAVTASSDSEVNGKSNRRVEYKIMPSAGLNQFKAIASNKMGIDSQPQELSLEFAGNAPKTTLHVVTVGINNYQDNRLNLNYSVADAKSIVNILGNKDLVSFQDVVPHEIFDQQATKEGILAQLKKIAEASQNDAMVIYLAGHGIAVNGEWYFLPYETRYQDNEQYYAQVGVSASEIRDLMTKIPLQKIVIMVDACYSGAGLEAFRNLQNTQRHFSRAVSKSAGIVVLAATRQDQEAAELTDLGHGLFTYVVTQGLGGAADIQPRDQTISAHEVVNFSTATIPTLSMKYIGASQEPTSFTMGGDFNLLGRK